MTAPGWWQPPRAIWLVVDNPSWILPWAERLVAEIDAGGDQARLARDHAEIGQGAVAFYLGCIKITPPDVLARNRRNLVVHASDLPNGRGFSPLTWLTLEGKSQIPVCLIEAVQEVDAGPVVLRDQLNFEGHELIDEMRAALGEVTARLCRLFLESPEPLAGTQQEGEPSTYPRRYPKDSRLDPNRAIAMQFNLLRTVDNDAYPAYFDLNGHRYRLRIEKFKPTDT